MRRIAIGLAVGVAVFVGSAVAAEAQVIQIDPIGPTSVTPSTTQTTYSATVTAQSPVPASYQIFLEVFVNGETTPHFSNSLTPDSYTYLGTFTYRKRVTLTGWNLHGADVLTFRLNYKWTTDTTWQHVDRLVTVSGS